jgi:hypothetical protein
MVLAATGRKPNSQGLGLDALGIEDASALSVDASMRLSRPGLYAVGDVTGLSFLDSTAYSQANVALNAILGKESRLDHRGIPRCIHTEPAIATVGWTESEAAVLERLHSLAIRMVALRCAGYNNVDLAAAGGLGLTVGRVPAYSPEAVAEHTVALMLALNRKIYRAYNRRSCWCMPRLDLRFSKRTRPSAASCAR